jgi:dTDP-4-amino-4,6-dideoxygalactose transaminase
MNPPGQRSDEPVADDVPFHQISIDEVDIEAVVGVLRSGWLTTGPQARAFEEAFAAFLGGGVTALAVNSCTSALHLALEAVGVGPGDYVLTTPYTFTATGEVVRYLGAHPVFADVDPETGNLTADTVLEAYDRMSPWVRSRIRALLPVHFAGLPCDLTALTRIAADHGWALVDDAAHALPASHAGVPVGAWGCATAFSFYATKTLCTGEGGMVVTADEQLAQRMRVMRLHGIDRDAFDRYATYDSWRYDIIAPGFKYNLTDLAAALGLSQLPRVPAMRERRAAVARTYDEALAGVDGLHLPPQAAADQHAWHLYALRVDDGAEVRDQLVRELAADGVGTSVHFIPLHLQSYYRDAYRLDPEAFPAANQLFSQEISLPLFPGMTADQVSRVADAVPRALRRARAAASRP